MTGRETWFMGTELESQAQVLPEHNDCYPKYTHPFEGHIQVELRFHEQRENMKIKMFKK